MVIRISEVKMQKTDDNQTARSTHRRVKSSTTLNRKYVKKPMKKTDMTTVAVRKSSKIKKFNNAEMGMVSNQPQMMQSVVAEQPIAEAEPHPMQVTAMEKIRKRSESTKGEVKKMSAKELKDQAIQKALASASQSTDVNSSKVKKKKESHDFGKVHFGFGRIVLALSCAAAAVFAIVYFVNLNMPDISLRVAAMQTGIEASYPGYVPRDYSLSDITSEDGKITLNFKNASTGDAFTLIEEQSSWDSNALLTNYVKDAYGDNYSVIREQGLTIYISGSDASWVNGGVVYKLKTTSGSLTKKQIRSIAVSL